jgi:hypothetical protein
MKQTHPPDCCYYIIIYNSLMILISAELHRKGLINYKNIIYSKYKLHYDSFYNLCFL